MLPDKRGYFKDFGGKFAPESLVFALSELEKAYYRLKKDRSFQKELGYDLSEYAGRPTPLYYAKNLSRYLGLKLYLKREDLCHTGAHKINNCLGQVLLAKRMGKKRIIAETGAGQHGVATATASALLGLKCVVYMGEVDIERQKLNVYRMNLLGAEVIPVKSGGKVLKDAVNEAMRDWITNVKDTHYVLGSVVGPHPYPVMVRDFQLVIGKEAKRQIIKREKRLPDYLIACVGGGSNSLGLFHPFYRDKEVKFIGVEAAGRGLSSGKHSAPLCAGRPGILHGNYSYLMQDKEGQILNTHSVAAGLDYPGVGPEHSFYKETGRAIYVAANDREALSAFHLLSEKEGIIPALESSHAIAYLEKASPGSQKSKVKSQKSKVRLKRGDLVIICLSGRGDKDVTEVGRIEKLKIKS